MQPQGRSQQQVHAHGLVGELVDEGVVGAVFQQPAHQVRQQVAVLAHGRIHAHRHGRREAQDLAVDPLAHAVQPLQLELRGYCRGHLQDRCDRAGVVRGELRVDHVVCLQESAGAREVGDVRVVLVREHRVIRQPLLLRPLDLGVPVRALDEPAHEAQPVLAGQRRDVLHEFERAGLVGLQRQPEALPLRKSLRDLRRERVEHFQRQLQPVHLLGVDREADMGARGALAQAPHPRHQLGQDAFALGLFIARVQGTELDRDAVVELHGTVHARAGAHRVDPVVVAGEVAQGVVVGAGAFAQHVVGELQAVRGAPDGVRLAQRFVHVLSQHELASQQLNGAQGCRDHAAGSQFAQQTRLMLRIRQESLGHRDGGLRQPRQGAVGRTFEIGSPELVGGERDRGLRVGHPQQRLGQAHQCEALGAGDRVFLEQALHRPERRRMPAHRQHPGPRCLLDDGPVQRRASGRERRLGDNAVQRLQEAAHDVGFGAVRQGQALGSGHG